MKLRIKKIRLVTTLLAVPVIICVMACRQKDSSIIEDYTRTIAPISNYRDTIVGKFNGKEIDTLICEPTGPITNDDYFGDYYTEWRVFSTKGTVNELKIGDTIGIKFLKEGDVDGNGTEEWGFLNEWVTSAWTNYKLFTYKDGQWKLMVDPITIWYDHLEMGLSASDIVRPSDQEGYLRIKTSQVIDDYTYWAVIDSIVPINPHDYIYKPVE
ncbi:MAG: hypothetical protein K2K82_08600 [Muribaculaceae bacterium]|nr:hypothetical protein [Muribaculaceae bacterium]